MKTIGIAGGGQLGRMLTDAARGLGFRVVVLDPTPDSPAAQVADEQIVGDYKNAVMLRALAEKSDFLTYEIESVNVEALEEISHTIPVNPSPKTLSIIKDKLLQKRFLQDHDIPVAAFSDEIESFGYPYILKARSGGFDGRGNARVENTGQLQVAKEKLKNSPAYAERIVPFEKELAIVAVRTNDGNVEIYPLVETIHKNHICHEVLAPASVGTDVAKKAHDLGQKVLGSFDGAGVFAIEMFLVGDDVLVNEVAPRVHNSGHFTIEACETSQFENHIRAVAGMPLGSVAMKVPAAVMVNILGGRSGEAEPKGVETAEKIEGVKVHIYGKMDTRPERKMGHITAVAETLGEAKEKAEKARTLVSI
jgi:phosphoribosylaminoimidazole carboxylase